MIRLSAWLACPVICVFVGCTIPTSHPASWTAEKIKTTKGFSVPECTVVDPDSGTVYVSNINADPENYWADDKKGHISTLDAEGNIESACWLNSTRHMPLHSPKGMCILSDHLFFTDNTRLVKVPLDGASKPSIISIPGAERLNDLATDGDNIWISDTAAGQVHRLDKDGRIHTAAKVAGVNGLGCHDGRVFAVSWTQHEVFELTGPDFKTATALNLADHFSNLDGIEILDDGHMLVSDFTGNKVSCISPDHKTVTTLITIESPADIGINRTLNHLYIPGFLTDSVHTFKLNRTACRPIN